MKNIQLLLTMLVVFTFLSCSAEQNDKVDTEQLEWLVKMEDALSLAQEKSLPVLVNFTGSDWCGWCIKLQSEVFSQPEFITYARQNLILLKLDFPRNIPQTEETKIYNRLLLEQYGIQGFPTILLVNEKGNEFARTGYQPGGASKYVEHIKQLIQKKR